MKRETIDYFEIWLADKQSMLNTMICNMQADLQAGYSPTGKSITDQQLAIAEYQYRFEQQFSELQHITDEKRIQNICKRDLLKRGAIEL